MVDPAFPDGFCTIASWPYCQDCEATGIWYLKVFCEEYPEDRWRAQVLYDLAGAYEDTGEAALAADVYEEFIDDYPDDPQVAQAEARLRGLGRAD